MLHIHPVLCTKLSATVSAALMLVFTSVAPAADPVRVALLAGNGEGAPAAAVDELVLAGLADRPEVELVDRRRVRELLAEQRSSLSSAAAPESMVQAGRVVAADVFVFLEAVTVSGAGNEGVLLRQRIVAYTDSDGIATPRRHEPPWDEWDECNDGWAGLCSVSGW